MLQCCALLGACAGSTTKNASPASSDSWSTDVIGVEEQHLNVDFWLERTRNKTRVIMSGDAIREFNELTFATDPTMVRLAEFPDTLTAEALKSRIRSISKIPDSPRFYADGREVTAADFAVYESGLNLEAVADINPVRFGLVVRRASMRSYPTNDSLYKAPDDLDLDRFQENAVFPADAVAVLHESRDGEWLLVQTYNYLAWVPADVVAIGDRDTMLDYKSRDDFLVITGDKVSSNYNPTLPEISEVQFDMGVRLPLVSHSDAAFNVHGQNPFASHIVEVPVRNPDGTLRFEQALIARSRDINKGYLPYTRENLLRQAFKFLGERYGWGHAYNARDCTGFVSEIYKTFGIPLPRNSGDQSRSTIGVNKRFADDDHSGKMSALQKLDVGDLIYIPGHVVMVIGEIDNKPYVIHDVSNLKYRSDDGEYYSGVLSGVSVTPFLPLSVSPEISFVDSIQTIKSIRN